MNLPIIPMHSSYRDDRLCRLRNGRLFQLTGNQCVYVRHSRAAKMAICVHKWWRSARASLSWPKWNLQIEFNLRISLIVIQSFWSLFHWKSRIIEVVMQLTRGFLFIGTTSCSWWLTLMIDYKEFSRSGLTSTLPCLLDKQVYIVDNFQHRFIYLELVVE